MNFNSINQLNNFLKKSLFKISILIYFLFYSITIDAQEINSKTSEILQGYSSNYSFIGANNEFVIICTVGEFPSFRNISNFGNDSLFIFDKQNLSIVEKIKIPTYQDHLIFSIQVKNDGIYFFHKKIIKVSKKVEDVEYFCEVLNFDNRIVKPLTKLFTYKNIEYNWMSGKSNPNAFILPTFKLDQEYFYAFSEDPQENLTIKTRVLKFDNQLNLIGEKEFKIPYKFEKKKYLSYTKYLFDYKNSIFIYPDYNNYFYNKDNDLDLVKLDLNSNKVDSLTFNNKQFSIKNFEYVLNDDGLNIFGLYNENIKDSSCFTGIFRAKKLFSSDAKMDFYPLNKSEWYELLFSKNINEDKFTLKQLKNQEYQLDHVIISHNKHTFLFITTFDITSEYRGSGKNEKLITLYRKKDVYMIELDEEGNFIWIDYTKRKGRKDYYKSFKDIETIIQNEYIYCFYERNSNNNFEYVKYDLKDKVASVEHLEEKSDINVVNNCLKDNFNNIFSIEEKFKIDKKEATKCYLRKYYIE